MIFLFWDASALAKRFTNEIGHKTANTVFDQMPDVQHLSTLWGYVETHSILRRRYNSGALQQKDFNEAVTLLRLEFGENETFQILDVDVATMYSSIVLIDRHNLNSTDAVLLTALLNFARSSEALVCVMVSADKRLLRAAEAEGLPALNPETASAEEAMTRVAALG